MANRTPLSGTESTSSSSAAKWVLFSVNEDTHTHIYIYIYIYICVYIINSDWSSKLTRNVRSTSTVCNLNVRQMDGSQIRKQFNATDTLDDVMKWIEEVSLRQAKHFSTPYI
jgi:hypothetical protein